MDVDPAPVDGPIYTAAQFATMTILMNNASTDLMNVDPKFVDVSPTYYNQPKKFNFGLAAGSPATHSGSQTAVPSTDLMGNTFAPIPSLGAIESPATADPP